MRKPRTRFEQVPIEEVKKIIARAGPKKNDEIAPGNVEVERPSTKTEPHSIGAFVHCRIDDDEGRRRQR